MRCDEGKDEISWDKTAPLLVPAAVNEDTVVVTSATQIHKLITMMTITSTYRVAQKNCTLYTLVHTFAKYWPIFGRPYYRSRLWYTLSSVCLSSVCRLSVTFCIVAKWYILAKNCLKWIGNQGQKVDFLGRRHISTSGFASTATETAVFALFLPYFCPYSPAVGTRW